jgi:hypothetical protein
VAENFDAYHRWLGIPAKDQPPHHYRLLALEPFESDLDVIESAADRQMGHLRTYQTGKNAALSQKLLNEVAAAKICLLNAAKKAAYDAELRERWATSPPLPQLPGSAGIDPAVAGLIEQAEAATPARRRSAAGRGAVPRWAVVGVVLAIGAVAMAVVATLTMRPSDPADRLAEGPVAAANAPAATLDNPTRQDEPTTTPTPTPKPDDSQSAPAAKIGPDDVPSATLPSLGPGDRVPPAEFPDDFFNFGPPSATSPAMPSATTDPQTPTADPAPSPDGEPAPSEEPTPSEEPAADKKGPAQPKPEAKKEPYRTFEGTWVIRFVEPGKGRRYVIEAGGDVAWGSHTGHLTKTGKDTVIEFDDGTLDRVKVVHNRSGSALEVERFASKATYPATVAQHGEGRRVVRKERPDAVAQVARAIQGLYAVQFENKTYRAYLIQPDGEVVSQNLDAKGKVVNPENKRTGRLAIRDGDIILDFRDGALERLERSPPQGLWIEQYRPPSDYPHSISLFGIGVKR